MQTDSDDERLAALRARLTPDQLETLRRRLGGDAVPPVAEPPAPAPATPAERPLSAAERRFWFLERLAPGTGRYVIPVAFELTGRIDEQALRIAFTRVVARHPVLRSVYRERRGVPYARISDRPTQAFRTHGPGPVEAVALARARAAEPLDPENGPLLEVDLFLREGGAVLLLRVHHLVADGAAVQLILDEVSALFGGTDAEPEPAPDYSSHTAWQESLPQEASVAFWRDELSGAEFALDLPTDAARPAVSTGAGAELRYRLPPEAAAACRDLARRHSATLFMAQLAILAALLSRYTGHRDLVIGVPVSGRTRTGWERLVGLLVNTVPVRIRLAPRITADELTAEVRDACLRAFSHQDLPLDRLLRAAAPGRPAADARTFQILADAQTPFRLSLGTIPCRGLRVDTGTSKVDLAFSFQDDGVVVSYDRDLFGLPFVERLMGHFVRLAVAAASTPDAPVLGIGLEPAPSVRREPPSPETVATLVARRAALDPDAPAVVSGTVTRTYAALDGRADRIAHVLRAGGAATGVPTAVRMDPCLELPEVLLGVLRAGGCYLPLDPGPSGDRVLAGVRPRVMIAHRAHASLPPGCDGTRVIVWEELEPLLTEWPEALPPPHPDDLACILPTTGDAPAGVEITHRGIAALVREARHADGGPGQVFLLLAPPSSSTAVFELWAPLCTGAALAVPPRRPLTAADLGPALESHGVTVLSLTTELLREVAHRPGVLSGLRHLVIGGGVPSPAELRAVRDVAGPLRVSLVHGAAETTGFGIADRAATDRPFLLGQPVPPAEAHVIDDLLHPSPPGVPGNLAISGPGLARGYHRDAAATAARFVANPFGPGRLFLTGDRAARRSDGRIEVFGRAELATPAPEPRPPVAARNDRTAREITAIWTDLLGVDELEPDDDFFDLGGHSLLAMTLVDRIRDRLGAELPIRAVMERRTIAGLTAGVHALGRSPEPGPAADGDMVLLTGGTGMTGRFIAAELGRRGLRVRMLTRERSRSRAAELGGEPFIGDLADPASLAAALDGVTAVVHAATTFTEPRIDIAATRALLDRWPGGPMVFISSTDVYGAPTGRVRAEDAATPGGYSPYADGKIECERLIAASGVPYSLLRPPYVWGPDPYCLWQLRMTAGAPLARAHSAGRPVAAPGDRGHAWVDARELAWITAECLTRPVAGPLNTVNGHFSWYELATEAVALLGLDCPVTPGPSDEEVYLGDGLFDSALSARLHGPRPIRSWRETLAEAARLGERSRAGQ
jgi:non-ribosomal peptide synthetase component F/nucleoside-diphosphate-sugar epimerase/acyl carrier protein